MAKPISMSAIIGGKTQAKASAKKKSKAKAKNEVLPVLTGEPKTVRITQAQNGFTVSHYGRDGEVIKVAKDIKEGINHVMEMMK